MVSLLLLVPILKSVLTHSDHPSEPAVSLPIISLMFLPRISSTIPSPSMQLTLELLQRISSWSLTPLLCLDTVSADTLSYAFTCTHFLSLIFFITTAQLHGLDVRAFDFSEVLCASLSTACLSFEMQMISQSP